jgi:thymidylate kinase
MLNIVENIKFALTSHDIVVLDRFWLSEVVYSTVFPRIHQLNHASLFHVRLEEFATVLYVACKGDRDTYLRNVNPAHPYEVENWEKVCVEYRVQWLNLKQHLTTKVIDYDFTQTTISDVIDHLKGLLHGS